MRITDGGIRGNGGATNLSDRLFVHVVSVGLFDNKRWSPNELLESEVVVQKLQLNRISWRMVTSPEMMGGNRTAKICGRIRVIIHLLRMFDSPFYGDTVKLRRFRKENQLFSTQMSFPLQDSRWVSHLPDRLLRMHRLV